MFSKKQPVFIVCGVSGSGKTWVCKQLQDKFHYIPNDEHYTDHSYVVSAAASVAKKPVLTEVPFGERVLREELEKKGCRVKPVFVIEKPDVVKKRYEKREGKLLPKNAYTRASTIVNRAIEWGSPAGTSQEVYEYLKNLEVS